MTGNEAPWRSDLVGKMKILCVLGKYAYGDPARGVSPEYAAMLPALARLGHEVIHFESWQRSRYPDYKALNRELLGTVKAQMPSMMLVVQMNYEVWLETLTAIRALETVTTVCWNTDDSWKYREVSRFVGPYYDVMATTYESRISDYHRDGLYNVLPTQWAARQDALCQPLPAEKCLYPVSFVGYAHGNRRHMIDSVRRAGIEVACFGHGWGNGPVATGELERIVRESVVSLGFTNSKGENQVKARTFEVPGAGGFLLTERAAGIEKYYRSGKEIAVFSGKKELISQIRYYLTHPEERDAMAWAGYRRTCREHTYDSRMRELLAKSELLCQDRESETLPSGSAALDDAFRKCRVTLPLKVTRYLLVSLCRMIWGKKRGPRAARRLLFEFSWRFLGSRTFSAAGLPGRLFPEQ